MEKGNIAEIRDCALSLLARREHSRLELQRKLLRREFNLDNVQQVLQQLAEKDLQSDARFTEAYVRMRSGQGYGPLRIEKELVERGIAEDLIVNYLNPNAEIWLHKAAEVRKKKFGTEPPKDFAVQAKQMRFLQYRGFSLEQIKAA